MSYSYKIKKRLLALKMQSCCRSKLLLGFLNSVCEDRVKFSVRHSDIFDYIAKEIDHFLPENHASTLRRGTQSVLYTYMLPEAESSLLFDCLEGDVSDDFSACCAASYLRGAFLGGGFLADPATRFHLEIHFPKRGSEAFALSCCNKLDVQMRCSVRKDKPLLYLKKPDDIGAFLATVGLSPQAFDYVNAGIEKNILNTVNRQMNCESGNMTKRVEAAERQRVAIEYFAARGFEGLSAPLVRIAKARMENPDANLSEIAEILDPPISKSGAAHRLNRILYLYEESQI